MAKNNTITPQEVIAIHEENVRKSLEENSMTQHLVIHFPNRKKPPVLARLCIWIVNSYGGIIATKYRFSGDTIINKSRRR